MDFVGMLYPLCGAMLFLLLLAKLIAGNADRGREARATEDGRIEFAPNRRSYWGAYVFCATFILVAIVSLARGPRSIADLTVPVACIGFVLLLLVAFPATIVADDKGLEQIFWLRRKRIAWKEVGKVDVNEKSGEVKIAGKSGVKILHARQLPDRARLLKELDEHCTERLVPAPPAPATLAMSGSAAKSA